MDIEYESSLILPRGAWVHGQRENMRVLEEEGCNAASGAEIQKLPVLIRLFLQSPAQPRTGAAGLCRAQLSAALWLPCASAVSVVKWGS